MLALLAGVTLLSPRRVQAQAASQSQAERLASDLRLARSRALSTGVPAGISFNQGLSQGYFSVSGESLGKVRGLANFQGEGASFFVGRWPGPSPNTPSSLGSAGSIKNLAANCLCFLPDGRAVGNFALLDHCYRIAVVESARTSGENLQACSQPVTVSVSPSGDIRVEGGLFHASAGIVQSEGLGRPVLPPLRRAAGGANRPPAFSDLQLDPEPNPQTLGVAVPQGSTASLARDGTLTLTVYADDPDGDPVWMEWSSEEGKWSSQQPTRMTWDAAREKWRASWSWKPPTTAREDQLFPLSCTLTDGRGGRVDLSGADVVIPRVALLPAGRLYYMRRDQERDVYRPVASNWDGTAVRDLVSQLSLPGSVVVGHLNDDGSFRWSETLPPGGSPGSMGDAGNAPPDDDLCQTHLLPSPDGNKVALWHETTGDPDAPHPVEIFNDQGESLGVSMVVEGSSINCAWSLGGQSLYVARVPDAMSAISPPPNGRLVLYEVSDILRPAGPHQRQLVDLEFSSAYQNDGVPDPVYGTLPDIPKVLVHPDGEYLFVTRTRKPNEIIQIKLGPSPVLRRLNWGGAVPVDFFPEPGDRRVLFRKDGQGCGIGTYDPASGTWTAGPLVNGLSGDPRVPPPRCSPDGRWLVYGDQAGQMFICRPDGTQPGKILQARDGLTPVGKNFAWGW